MQVAVTMATPTWAVVSCWPRSHGLPGVTQLPIKFIVRALDQVTFILPGLSVRQVEVTGPREAQNVTWVWGISK